MKYGIVALVFCVVIAAVFGARPAGAQKAFLAQFKATYVKPKTTDHTMQIFNAAVQAKGCGVCHRGKPSSKGPFNPYGAQLKKILTKADAQNPQAIHDALKKVAGMKSNPDDPSSQTFAQRLRDGKLPCGEIHVRSKDAAASN